MNEFPKEHGMTWKPRLLFAAIGVAMAFTVLAPLITVELGQAIVVEPPADAPEGHPPDAMVPQPGWHSAVAVAPDWILATRHQADGLGVFVRVPGDAAVYEIAEQVPSKTLDLVLSRLVDRKTREPAQLKVWAGVAETSAGAEVWIAGYGYARGEPLPDGAGYKWRADHSTLRWGTERVDLLYAQTALATWQRLGAAGATKYEAALATCDSGGPWLAPAPGGRWNVVAINAGCARSGESSFGDQIYAIRVGPVADWLQATVWRRGLLGDVNGDGRLDAIDKLLFNKQLNGEATGFPDRCFDLNGDGLVNAADKLKFNQALNRAGQ